MDPRFTRQEMAFLSPTNTTEAHGLKSALHTAWSALREMASLPRRRRVFAELSALGDRELADIGLTRTDIPRVFDRDFATEFSVSRRAAIVALAPANCNTADSKTAEAA